MRVRIFLSAVFLFSLIPFANGITPKSGDLAPGEVIDLSIPEHLRLQDLKGAGSREGYFYTPGPVAVAGYDRPSVVTIRDPAAPEPPVAVGTIEEFNPIFETNIPAGFYYISVTGDAGVLVGAAPGAPCTGFYHYKSTPEPYGNTALGSLFYYRSIGDCDNRMYIFAPQGASAGGTCCDVICIESCGISFDLGTPSQFFSWAAGNQFGLLGVNVGQPVQVLTRDDLGYFVPPHTQGDFTDTFYRTFQDYQEYLNVHSFAEDVTYEIRSMHSDSMIVLATGTLQDGKTFSYLGEDNGNHRVLSVRTPKGKSSVSVLGGIFPEQNVDYMTYVLDQNGKFQGTDFITRSHNGGFLYITGLEDDTAVEVREASTEELQSIQYIDEAQLVNANPGAGIWRVRADKDITVAVGHGSGGTFIPLTQNVTGSTPYPPVIAGVRWNPYFPRTSDSFIEASFLTDEISNGVLNYKVGSGPWLRTAEGAPTTEHLLFIPIFGLTLDTVVRFRPEARDQSGAITVDNNGGADYVVTVRKDAPDLEVTLSNVIANDDSSRTLRFFVQNNGAGNARTADLILGLEGLQPMTDGVTGNYASVSSNQITASLRTHNIGPGGSRFIDLKVYPYLSHTGSVNYRLTSCSSSARSDFNHTSLKNHPAAVHDFDDAAIEAEFRFASYVVLANVHRFFIFNPSTAAASQRMPAEMAQFCAARGAALAYVSTGSESQIRTYIQGRFHAKITNDWRNGGTLLLVGCSGVMPSFGWRLSCSFTDDTQIWMSDNTYANLDNDDHFTPELILGRITGDHADTYSSLFERAVTPFHFQRAFSISGTGDGEGAFSDSAAECRRLLDDRYGTSSFVRMKNLDPSDYLDAYEGGATNTDFFYYRNHGNIGSWEGFGTGSVSSLSFGSKFPIIYSNACLTGQIQTAGNLAEAFLAHSAAVFIGATEVSPRSANNTLGRRIVDKHKNGESIGSAFRNAKRSLAGDIEWYTTCYQDQVLKRNILTYNLYGDPRRGGSAKSLKAGPLEKIVFDPPQETLNLMIPQYLVETDDDGTDYVRIPDEERGSHLDVVSEPLVPSYQVAMSYSPGTRVADIQLVSKSDKTNESGLVLPISWWNQKVIPGPGDGPSPGVFPEDDFHWTGIERIDGGQDVMLTVHPFFYNAETTDATFYQTYSFDIEFVSSTVEIESITPTFEAVPVGSIQEFDVHLVNPGGADVQVNLSVDIENVGTNDVVSSQSQNNLTIPAGGSLIRHFIWDPAGSEQTHYRATARARLSATGDELDAAFSLFRSGVPDVQIQALRFQSPTAGFIGAADILGISMALQNVGDVPTNITMTVEMRHALLGHVVGRWQEEVHDLPTGLTSTIQLDWPGPGLLEGGFNLIGWSQHEGGTTDPEVVSLETKQRMRWSWGDLEDVYLHGDKIVGTANLVEPSGNPAGLADAATAKVVQPGTGELDPNLMGHLGDPSYSTSFIVNGLEPSGLHNLVSEATKTGYENAAGNRWFVVSENPFALSATPECAIADGVTVIDVESDVVMESGSPVPDGTLLTVSPLVGSVVNPDASPTLEGIQVAATSGRFAFGWRSPTVSAWDAFCHVFLGEERPQSGISAVFKGIDFNGNRRVDAADIGFIRSASGDLFGTDAFDERKDVNGDGVIDAADAQELIERWPLAFPEASLCPTCSPEAIDFGVKIRPVPDRAIIPPGGSLTVSIVAEGLDMLGGYEFGAALIGDLDWKFPPQINTNLKGIPPAQTALGPILIEPKTYRMGAVHTGEGAGLNGMITLATFELVAMRPGSARLVLSDPVLVKIDGMEQAVMSAMEGIYVVGAATPTPSATEPTPTTTATPTITQTPTRTTTPTQTLPETNYDIWPPPDGDGEVDGRDLLEWIEAIQADDANGDLIFDFARFWEQASGK